ncbi:hypothetical protein [Alkalibacillus haloalkaliphilus]|uniref:hypothetical protein n=1 Tax=Alkalibacillus haloalkaliphilus TaxID=94136 RepID=UPI002935C736|nr:hypothetical protein [Alkalibacillus haloalkaliphilus]MDV2582214.1 hypothetical protein [Alkalibacillus haloalkaliphilus]
MQNQKNTGVAALLSFLYCGLGQIYNGEFGKAIGFMIGYFVSILSMFILIGFITTPALWIWGMIDAYKSAEKINAKQAPPQQQSQGDAV